MGGNQVFFLNMDFKESFFKEEFINAASAIEWHHYQEKIPCSGAHHSC